MEVKLKKWTLDDAPYMANTLNNKNVIANLRDGFPFPYTEEDAKSFIAFAAGRDANSLIMFAITVDGEVVGNISAERKENIHNRTAEVGYYIGEAWWGRGITSAALSQLKAYVFNNTDLIRLFAEPFADNIGSRRVLEKNGFVCEGIMRANAIKNDVVKDMAMYAYVKG